MTTVMTEQEGQGLVEYALIIALIAVLLITALATLRQRVGTSFNTIGNAL